MVTAIFLGVLLLRVPAIFCKAATVASAPPPPESTPNPMTPAPKSPSQMSMRSMVSEVQYNHHVIYLPDGQGVLVETANPSNTVLLPANSAKDFEIQKSPVTGIEAVCSIGLGTVMTATCQKTCIQ